MICFPFSVILVTCEPFPIQDFLASCLRDGIILQNKRGKFLPFEFQNLKSWQKQYVWKKNRSGNGYSFSTPKIR